MTFEEILQDNNIATAGDDHHHARQGWIQFDCPWCGQDTGKFHMGYNEQGKFVNCWRCGSHSLVDTLIKLTGLHYRHIKMILEDIDDGIHIKIEKTKGNYKPPNNVGVLGKAHKNYLIGRKFDWETLERLWDLQGIGISASLGWRLFIPVHHHGKPVSWTTRSISDTVTAKYINAKPEEEDVPLKSLLYGEEYVRHAIVICEGPSDVWRIGPGAVATMGIGYTQAQMLRMIQYPIRAVCFDNDLRAQERAKKLTDDLSAFPGETLNILIDEADPGVASPSTVKKIRDMFLE